MRLPRAMRRSPALAALSVTLLMGCYELRVSRHYPVISAPAQMAQGLSEKAAMVGAVAPDIALPASTGGTWQLQDAVKEGPVVLVFFRGDW